MKELIRSVLWGSTEGETFTLTVKEARRAVMKREGGESNRSAPLTEALLDHSLDEIAILLGKYPDAQPCAAPLCSEVHLNDGTVRYLPHDALKGAMDTAWEHAMIERSMNEQPQLMGLVACPTPPPTGMPMDAFNTMGLFGMMGMAQQPVWNDDKTWRCTCGTDKLTGKFCPECGHPAPQPQEWTCPNCGKEQLTGKFCPDCGTAR